MAPRYSIFTQNPGKKIAAVNQDLEDLADNLKAALDNDPTNASVAEGKGYIDLAKKFDEVNKSINLSNSKIEDLKKNEITYFKSKIEDLKKNEISYFKSKFFESTWGFTENYQLPTITKGQYPLFGLDNIHSDALVMPFTDGMSDDWETEFINTVIDKKVLTNDSNSLKYTGSGSLNEHSLVTTKEYNVADGFNFSCKVKLTDDSGDSKVLGYNAIFDASGVSDYLAIDASGVSDYLAIDASGTTEVEIVMIKEQDSSKVRVWIDGLENNTTVYPDFTGGRLVVFANPNATFSNIRLTDTTIDLGISKIIENFNTVLVSTFQSSNPITQEIVDVYEQANVVVRNNILDINPGKDVSGTGYIFKVGAAQYYQIMPGDTIDDLIKTLQQYGNIYLGIDLKLGGVGDGNVYKLAEQYLQYPSDKSVTLSSKYYSKNIAYLREGITYPHPYHKITWESLTSATQNMLKVGFKELFPLYSDQQIIYIIQTQLDTTLINVINLIGYTNRPLQSSPEFINMAPSSIVEQNNPNGNFTATNIESYSQLSKILDYTDYHIDNSNITITQNHSFDTTESVKQAILTELSSQFPYIYGGLIPEHLETNSWILNTLDKSTLDSVITNIYSFPTYDEFNAFGIKNIADQFVRILNEQSNGNGLELFNSLSFKDFAENLQLNNFSTGKTITINALNGDYTINMNNLQSDDSEKFRVALSMKKSADVQSAMNISEQDKDRFFYIVFGMMANSTSNIVSWTYLPRERNKNNVWQYARHIGRYIDNNYDYYTLATVDREESLVFIDNISDIPDNVIQAYYIFYDLNLNDNIDLQQEEKYLVRYTGIAEYYIYVDMSNSHPEVYMLLAVQNSATGDDEKEWFDAITFFRYTYIQSGEKPPDDDKLDYKVYKTWNEVENRLRQLATPSDYEWKQLETLSKPLVPLATGSGKVPIFRNDLKVVSLFTDMWSDKGVTNENFIVTPKGEYIPQQDLDVRSNRNIMSIDRFDNGYVYSCDLSVNEVGSHACLLIAIEDGESVKQKYIDFDASGYPKLRDVSVAPETNSGLTLGKHTLELKISGRSLEIVLDGVSHRSATVEVPLSGHVGMLCNKNIEFSNVRLEKGYDRLTDSIILSANLAQTPLTQEQLNVTLKTEKIFYYENGATDANISIFTSYNQNIGPNGNANPDFWSMIQTFAPTVSPMPTSVKIEFTLLDGSPLPTVTGESTYVHSDVKFIKEVMSATVADRITMSRMNAETIQYHARDTTHSDAVSQTHVVGVYSAEGLSNVEVRAIFAHPGMRADFDKLTDNTKYTIKDFLSKIDAETLYKVTGGLMTQAMILNPNTPDSAFEFTNSLSSELLEFQQGFSVLYRTTNQLIDKVGDVINIDNKY